MPFTYPCTPPASQKGVDILLAGTQELQEVHILVPARLRDTQKNEVFLNSRGRRRPFNDVPQRGKRLHRVLGVIVVPPDLCTGFGEWESVKRKTIWRP